MSGSSPGFVTGQVPTAAEWNSAFAGKLDLSGGSVTGNLLVGSSSTNYWQLNGANGFVQAYVKGTGNASMQFVLGGQNSAFEIVNGASGGIASFTDLTSGAAVANSLNVFNGATGSPMRIRAVGSDTNRTINLEPGGVGGVTIAPLGNTYSGSSWSPQFYLNTALSGTTTAAGTTNVHQVTINSDTLDASGSALQLVNYGGINASFGGAGMKGNRQGFDASINLFSASGNPTGGAYVGIVGAASASASDNGTGLTPGTVGGSAWGANFYVTIGSSVRNWGGLVGIEVNPAANASSTYGNVVGIGVIPTASHAVRGAYHFDVGYLLTSQRLATGIDYGYVCGAPSAAWPLQPTGTIIYAGEPNTRDVAQARAAWGVDFTGPVFSGGFAKSIGFTVDGSGNVAGATLAVPGLSISNTGGAATIGTSGNQVSSITSIQAAGSGYWFPGDKFSFGTSGIGIVNTVKVVAASLGQGSAGSGGTNGTQTVTGTTGTGTKFQASVTVSGGAITTVNSITVAGDYSAFPGAFNGGNHLIEPVTGAGLVGASLDINLGANTVSQLQPDQTAAPPSNPVATAATNNFNSGIFAAAPSGLTLNLSYAAMATIKLGAASEALQMATSGAWSANGAVATALSSVGPTGSHTTVQEWFTVKNASGVTRYIPAF